MKRKIILIGDSITNSFPDDFQLKDYIIINKGIFGDNSYGVLKRLHEDVISENPDLVFLLIGTNDFAQGRSNKEIEENIYKILLELKNSLIHTEIFAVSILPVRDIENRSNQRITAVNSEIRKISTGLDINYFDMHSEFSDNEDKIKKEFTTDGLHLSVHGYEKWFELLKEILSEGE